MKDIWIGLSPVFIFLIWVACSASPSGTATGADAATNAPLASLYLHVEADSFDPPKAAHNEVDTFTIAVTGEGLAAPMVATYPVGTETAEITGIPAGAVVDVEVQASNKNGVIFKRGLAENVAIDTSIKEALLHIKQVPIFTNLKDGSVLRADRLRFIAYGHPDDRLTLSARDASGASTEITSRGESARFEPDPDTGLAPIYPQALDPGRYTLSLRDIDNGESSSLEIEVTSAKDAEPLLLTSGEALGSARYRGDDISTHFMEVLYAE
jgi:hypothetical protein